MAIAYYATTANLDQHRRVRHGDIMTSGVAGSICLTDRATSPQHPADDADDDGDTPTGPPETTTPVSTPTGTTSTESTSTTTSETSPAQTTGNKPTPDSFGTGEGDSSQGAVFGLAITALVLIVVAGGLGVVAFRNRRGQHW